MSETDLRDALLAAAQDPKRARQHARRLAPGFELPAGLAEAADRAAGPLIVRACRGGWLPEDFRQAASRRVDEFAGSYVLDALAAHATAVDPESLAEAGAVRWWTGAEPHLMQWAAKHILTPAEAVTAVVEALGLLLTLPVLATAPHPRPAAHPGGGGVDGVDGKRLGRVRALLAKAESSSFPEEAEALSAKAQELMTRYAFDRVLVEAAPDVASSRRIWLDTPYTDAKSLLVHVVAQANRCRAVFDARWDFVTVVGDEADLDAVALLTTSLLLQATRTMIADPAGRSRPFRKSFLVSYATRIGERLEQAADSTLAAAPDSADLLPVLASHDKRVATAFSTLFPEVVHKSVTVRSHEGWGAGRQAADRARLGE
ncbi:DUF2786 domain-containing protein [Amycolatopsis sp. lyj-23]|uniref:DUF2786 domain-containing protein n=1 Tax=Amycolatopsis sp. lyj-23 TaxID=2789283 RepID=UPI00397A08E9